MAVTEDTEGRDIFINSLPQNKVQVSRDAEWTRQIMSFSS